MKRIVFLTFLWFIVFHAQAQQPVQPKPEADKDSLVPVNIIYADKIREETKDSVKFQSLVGNVKLQQGKTFFYCDSVVKDNKQNIIEAFGNVHMNDSDTTNIFSQYMKYFVDKKYVIFQKKVKMTDGTGTLYTDDMQYDMANKIGTYYNGGKVINQTSVLTSKEGVYYAETKDIYFKKDVLLKDPSYDLKTDSLLYNTNTQLATFITKTYIRDSSGSDIVTKDGNYDLKNHKAYFGKRPTIHQGSQKITGETVQFDDSTGISIADGNAVYVDSLQGISVLSNHMIANRKTKTFFATEHPLMILKQEEDSIYVSADTLFSGKLSDLLTADSIKRHDDSIVAEKLRIRDSIYSDSIKIVKAKISDSLKTVSELIEKEEKRKSDSAALISVNISNTDLLKTVLAQENELLKKPEKKKTRTKNNPPPKQDSLKNDLAIKKSNVSDSTKLSPQALNDSLKNKDALAKNDSLKIDTSNNNAIVTDRSKSPQQASADSVDALKKDSLKNAMVNNSPPSDSSNRYLQAFHHVRIFSDSLQAVSDSLFYSAKDSIFRLYTNPIVWANKNQIPGDTIFLFTKNKKASRLYVFENGLVVMRVGDNLFNQVKGTTLNGYFKDGVIDFMRAKGNAESIYYAQDENKAFFGVNQSKADVIDMIFLNKELNKVVLRNDGEGTMFPIRKVNFDEMRLRNFKWLEDKRPKTKYELFGQ